MSTEVIEGTATDVGARELTDEERAERALEASKIEAKIKENIGATREALWDLCANLYEFDQKSGWTALGYDTQQEWLAQPEIGLKRADYFRMVRRHRELVVFRDIPIARLASIDPSKVDIVMPAIESNKGNVAEILDNASSMGARDLREMYAGVTPPPKPPPKEDEEPDKEVTVDGKAVKASDLAPAVNDKLVHALGTVDSWIDLGGDRRKASRAWKVVTDTHPLLEAVKVVEAAFAGGEGAPSREDAKTAWRTFAAAIDFAV